MKEWGRGVQTTSLSLSLYLSVRVCLLQRSVCVCVCVCVRACVCGLCPRPCACQEQCLYYDTAPALAQARLIDGGVVPFRAYYFGILHRAHQKMFEAR